MSALDEELLNKLTYLPECQATFRKYNENLMHEFRRDALIIVFIFITPIFILHILSENKENSFLSILITILISFIYSIFPILYTYKLYKDAHSNKLDITTDVFIKPIVKEAFLKETKYTGIFEKAGAMDLPVTFISKLRSAQNRKVYIVRTSYTKTLLDIVPAYKVENQT